MYLCELCILLSISQFAIALNILAIVSFPLRSHYMAFQPFFRELAVRGHSVTVINNFPEKYPVPNLRYVDISNNDTNVAGYFTPLEFYEDFDSRYLHLYNMYKHIQLNPGSNQADCENLFMHGKMKSHLAEGIKYDVIIVEQFFGDCGLVYAAVMFDAPIIGITSHVLIPFAYPRLGLPFDVSSDAFYFSTSGPNPTLYDKTETFLANLLLKTFGRWYIQRSIYEVFGRHLPHVEFDIEKLARERIKMMFAYQHFSLTGSRVQSPQVLEIAGIHVGKPKPVPESVGKFLSDAQHGAIYVSFGSNLKTNTMSSHKLQHFLGAFKRIPQKVLWKYENASIPAGYDNVYAHDWFPQLDVLCHPKILGFVTHGGMLSLSETSYCGKPVLVIPFFGDQFGNAAAARAVGIGNILHFQQLNADSLAEGIQAMMTQEMQQNAKRISKLWHDRPMPVMDSAIYWTEYVARHGSAPPPLPSQRTSWFESSLLDVAIVLLISMLLVSWLVLKLCRFFLFIIEKVISKSICRKKIKKE